jgi:hypothetical protein
VSASVIKIESLDQAIGGPVANARIGDYLLQNDKIKVVIEGGRESHLPLDVGGSIIDMDLVRPDRRFRGGRGLDQLGQIASVANLGIPRATNESDVRITKSASGAEVTAAATTEGILKTINAISLVVQRDLIDPNLPDKSPRMYVEYELRPGEQFLRVKTTLGFGVPYCPAGPDDGCSANCDDALYDDDCTCPTVPARCTQGVTVSDADALPDGPNRGLLDLFLGDIPRPLGTKRCTTDADCDASQTETCADLTQALGGVSRVCRAASSKDAGVFMGDMLLFGGHLNPFIPGTGYDAETDIRRLFDRGQDTLAQPLVLPEIFALGDRVSYGYAAPKGKILVPIFGGPFSLGATAGASCRHDQKGCLTNHLVRYERWISVGQGDASSAREPLARARGDALGTVTGSVTYAHSGNPITGAQVFAITDPRTLACDDACQKECDLTGVDDAKIRSWSIDDLFAANRCRSKGGAYVAGVPGIETVARTDPGTDTLLDGQYTMTLPPGHHVIVADLGNGTRSTLAPIDVAPDHTTHASMQILEAGRLDYAIFDERGQPSAGRLVIGRCLPGAPCGSDGDCSEGNTCQAGSCACPRQNLRPLELGGSRLADGTLVFEQTASGKGQVELPAGAYDVLFTHGPHSTVDKKSIKITAGVATKATGVVARSVDHTGWIAADFHVHAENSLDSGLAMADRATSFLAEDMDFLSSSDHDILSQYAPLLQSLGIRKRLGSQIGVEVTTQELGHFIGWPMKYDERKDGERLPGNDAPNWRGLVPADIFAEIRKRQGDAGPVVVEVPHPYTYFDFYRIDPVTLESGTSVLTAVNPLISQAAFSGDFDAMELMNSKSHDLIRRPTIAELLFYSQGLDALLARQKKGELDEVTFARLLYSHSTETVRRILHRTTSEQTAALGGDGASLPCRCGSDGDCAAGGICNKTLLTCEPAPTVTTVIREPKAPVTVAPPNPDGLCRSFRGVIDDWFNMLNRGVRRTGVGGSDVHGLYGYEAGCPRTMLRTAADTNPLLTSQNIAAAVFGRHSVVTNGPMVRFKVDQADIGDLVTRPRDQPVTLSVHVEKAPWYDVDRVEIYRNGELIHWAVACQGTRRSGDSPEPHGHPCLPTGDSAVVVYDDHIQDTPPRDSWYAVIALGLDGRPLSPVYSSATLSRFGTFEVAQRLYDLVPALGTLRTPRFPSLFPTFPIAITNPIWVDVDGDGWTPQNPPPSWCTSVRGDFTCGN